jgi:hypothetical protein
MCKYELSLPQPRHTSHTFTSTPKSHFSVVSVVLTCSAAPKSRAPASPMLLPERLPISVSTGKIAALSLSLSLSLSLAYL